MGREIGGCEQTLWSRCKAPALNRSVSPHGTAVGHKEVSTSFVKENWEVQVALREDSKNGSQRVPHGSPPWDWLEGQVSRPLDCIKQI